MVSGFCRSFAGENKILKKRENEDREDASIHTSLANTGKREDGKKERRRKKFDGIKGRDYLPQLLVAREEFCFSPKRLSNTCPKNKSVLSVRMTPPGRRPY